MEFKFRNLMLMICLGILLMGCSGNDLEKTSKQQLKTEPAITNMSIEGSKMEEVNQKIIRAFDFMVVQSIERKELNSEQLGELFIQRIVDSGIELQKPTDEEVVYSDEFAFYASLIRDAKQYNNSTDYIHSINALLPKIENNAKLIKSEKQKLITAINFMNDFVVWQQDISDQYEYETAWWDEWGGCVAGILGGAVTGATTLGLAGAAVGTVVLPIVGTVSAGLVGAIGGGIGGALTGAATFC